MAISSKSLMRILAPKFYTGDPTNVKAPTQTKVPGVLTVSSAFDKVDQRNLDVAKYTRKRVLCITPFMAENPSKASQMERYATRALKDSLNRNEAPVMSHLFYYSVLSSNDPIERDIGLHSQLAWLPAADLVAVYVDFGITGAMQVAINYAESKSKKIEYRSIGGVS